MNKNRPVNLDLSTVKFPITAIASITHRITGVILLGGVLILMWMLDVSLTSEEGFVSIKDTLSAPLAKFILWGVLSALAYHSAAGVRHLIMDMGIGETLKGGKIGAALTMIISAILIAAAGVWLW